MQHPSNWCSILAATVIARCSLLHHLFTSLGLAECPHSCEQGIHRVFSRSCRACCTSLCRHTWRGLVLGSHGTYSDQKYSGSTSTISFIVVEAVLAVSIRPLRAGGLVEGFETWRSEGRVQAHVSWGRGTDIRVWHEGLRHGWGKGVWV